MADEEEERGEQRQVRPPSLQHICEDLAGMAAASQSLLGVCSHGTSGQPAQDLFACACCPAQVAVLVVERRPHADPGDLVQVADATEKSKGQTSLPEYAQQVKPYTPEELRSAAAGEQRRLEDQTETLYCRAHESSLAFLEHSAWLKQADTAVASIQRSIDDAVERVEALQRLVSLPEASSSHVSTTSPSAS